MGTMKKLWGYEPTSKTWLPIKVNSDGKIIISLKWTDWTPTYACTGSMTYTSTTTRLAKYIIIDKILYFMLEVTGTLGGTADYGIMVILPETIGEGLTYIIGGGCYIYDNNPLAGMWSNDLTNRLRIYKYNWSKWNLGAGKKIVIQGFYRIV